MNIDYISGYKNGQTISHLNVLLGKKNRKIERLKAIINAKQRIIDHLLDQKAVSDPLSGLKSDE